MAAAIQWSAEQIAQRLKPKPHKYPTHLGLGLYVMTYATGAQSYCRREVLPNKKRFFPILGPVRGADAISIDEAFKRARAEAAPLTIRQDTERRAEGGVLTLRDLLTDFMAEVINKKQVKPDRKRRYEQVISDHFLNRPHPAHGSQWGEIPLRQLAAERSFFFDYKQTLLDAQNEASALNKKRGPSTIADKCDEFCQQMFAYANARGWLSKDHIPPVIAEANQPQTKNRILSHDELQRVLTVQPSGPSGNEGALTFIDIVYVRLLLRTGVRLNSMLRAKWSDIDAREPDVWTVRTMKKTKANKRQQRTHFVPILPATRALLEALREKTGASGWLFPERYWRRKAARGEEIGPRNESWPKHLLTDPAVAALIGNDLSGDYYTAHATRRTMTQSMIALGIPREMAKLAAGHALPGQLDKTYFDADVRAFIDRAYMHYHAYLNACIDGHGADYMKALLAETHEKAQAEIDERHAAMARQQKQDARKHLRLIPTR